jgi:gluconate kinase
MTGGDWTDATEFRAQAAQARWLAARALTDQDRSFWLNLAGEWHQLAVQAQLNRASYATVQSFKRAAIMDHLLQIEHHVMQGERHIERQREIVAKLERSDVGQAGQARELLAQFEQMQVMHVADRDRLRKSLEEPGAV